MNAFTEKCNEMNDAYSHMNEMMNAFRSYFLKKEGEILAEFVSVLGSKSTMICYILLIFLLKEFI